MAKISNSELHNGHLLGIGEASELSGISPRALRHYDSLNLVQPDIIGENKYRYYSIETILRIPVINYLKMMGFSLEEITEVFECSSYRQIKEKLEERSAGCQEEINHLKECQTTIDEWVELIDEANSILSIKPLDVSLKYFAAKEFLAMPYHFWGNYADATINLEFTSFVERNNNVISGPVILYAEDARAHCEHRKNNDECDMMVIQRALRPVEDPTCRFDRSCGMYLSTYHTGSFENIGEAHERVLAYADEHGYQATRGVFERYVTDYWTTYNKDLFVAEVLLPVDCGGARG